VPIAPGGEHFDNLPAPCNQSHQFPALGIRQGPGMRLDQFGEMGEDLCIDRVSLRQPAGGTRKVADLPRINHGYWQTRRGQFTGCRDFIAATGFEHDTANTQLLELLGQCHNAPLIVDHAEVFSARPQRHIESRFRHIDADEQLLFHHFLQTSRPSLRDTGLLALATVRALRFVRARRRERYPTVLKTSSRNGLSRPDLLKCWNTEDTRAPTNRAKRV
jgi:hypothetical protein